MRDVIVGTSEMTVAAAAKLMRHHHVGSLVIVDRVKGGLGIPLGRFRATRRITCIAEYSFPSMAAQHP